jgi:nucleoside-diphosphate-sugar epimerase
MVLKSNPATHNTVLVTGATGFLGGRLVEVLNRQGYRIKALVRKSSKTAHLQALGVELCIGDLQDRASIEMAMRGAQVVVHAAADTRGEAQVGFDATVQGTSNVIKSAHTTGIDQLIYISSCSVYGIAACRRGQVIDETGPLEPSPEQRGNYSNSKFAAEEIVRAAMKSDTPSITCLRPGTIWGPGGENFTPMMGLSLGSRLIVIIGSLGFVLPLVYLDNLVDAIILCIGHPAARGSIFNIVDKQKIDKKIYAREVLKPLMRGALFVRLPYWALYFAVACQEALCRAVERPPVLTRYRLISSQRSVVYGTDKIRHRLGWTPAVGFEQAVQATLGHGNE